MIDLTPQQIKDNAPEGATHYIDDIDGLSYWKYRDYQWLYYDVKVWYVGSISEYEESVMLKPL